MGDGIREAERAEQGTWNIRQGDLVTTQTMPTSVVTSRLERPREVTLATRILWVTLLLGVLNSILQWSHLREKASTGFILTVQGATLFIMAWLVYQTGRGRNWARILLLLLFVAGIALEPRALLASLTISTSGGAIVIVQLLLQLVSYYLLFVSKGRAWYARATRGV
jgi:hypothetical protein